MKKLFVILALPLFMNLAACSSFERIDTAEESTETGDDTGGLGSFSGSVGTFNMDSIVAAFYTENTDGTVSLLLADNEICCDCAEQTVDASLILMANIPNEAATFDETTDDLNMSMSLLEVTAGDTDATLISDTDDVTITVDSISDGGMMTGSYEGNFDDDSSISGTFQAEFCDTGN